MVNDIALFILESPIELNDYIKLACLPKYSKFFPAYNQTSYAVGWV